ncbi:MAG: aminotransferase class V-fold PLP-dependent enzyme [bacterium]
MIDTDKIRSDFKLLNGKNVPVYFDSACMSLKPNCVVEAMNEYYYEFPACTNRSPHKMGQKATKKVEEARKSIAKFINAGSEKEIIFIRNTSEGINLLVNSFNFKKDDIVLITDKEHNSNLVPWLRLKEKTGIILKIIPSHEDGTFNLENFKELVKGAKFVSVVHTSNLDGVTNPVEDIIKIAHQNGALVFLDVAQSIAHQKIDVKKLDIDFLAFSGHKMFGPTGTGVFYGKHKLLEELDPFLVGGDTVLSSTYDSYEMLPSPEKFEAGLQDYAGIIGLGEAVKYLSKIDFRDIEEHEYKINKYITEGLQKFPQIKIIGPADPALRSGIINFYIENTDMHKFAIMLDELSNIAIRSGRHCVHSWFHSKNIYNSARVSIYIYNTEEEAEVFIKSLTKILGIL